MYPFPKLVSWIPSTNTCLFYATSHPYLFLRALLVSGHKKILEIITSIGSFIRNYVPTAVLPSTCRFDHVFAFFRTYPSRTFSHSRLHSLMFSVDQLFDTTYSIIVFRCFFSLLSFLRTRQERDSNTFIHSLDQLTNNSIVVLIYILRFVVRSKTRQSVHATMKKRDYLIFFYFFLFTYC